MDGRRDPRTIHGASGTMRQQQQRQLAPVGRGFDGPPQQAMQQPMPMQQHPQQQQWAQQQQQHPQQQQQWAQQQQHHMQQLQQEAQRGSSSSTNTAGTELAEGGQARQSSAVRAAVKSAAMQVEALQKESTARGRSHTPDPLAARRSNPEAAPAPRPHTSAGLVSQPDMRSGLGPRSQEIQDAAAQNAFHSKTHEWAQNSPPTMMKELERCQNVDMRDEYGWTCLHWAALRGATDHVVALLDGGANSVLPSTSPISRPQSCGERLAGTTPEQLARAPAQGVAAHTKIVKMLMGAEQGHWQRRRDLKRNGDAAMHRSEYARAVDCYIDARKAVPVAEAYDSPVLQLAAALKEAKKMAAAAAGKAAAPVVAERRTELAPGGPRRQQLDGSAAGGSTRGSAAPPAEAYGAQPLPAEMEHGSSFHTERSSFAGSVHSSTVSHSAMPMGGGGGAGGDAAIANAVREAEKRHKSGDVQGTLSAIEDAIAYGFRSGEALSVKLLLRKVSTNLVEEALTAKSEAQAAKDYAQGRDSEVYELAVGKKRVEDEAVQERLKLVDEMSRAKRETDSLADTLQRASHDKQLVDRELEQVRSQVESQRAGWETEKREMEYGRNTMEQQIQSLEEQLKEVSTTHTGQTAELEQALEKLRAAEQDSASQSKELEEMAAEVAKAEEKASEMATKQSQAEAAVEQAKGASVQKVEELEAQIRRQAQDLVAAQKHAEAEASRADQGWSKAKEAAQKVDEEIRRARDSENQVASMEREIDQVGPRIQQAEARAARAEERADREMERADKEAARAEQAREAQAQQASQSSHDAQKLKELGAQQELLGRLQVELDHTKQQLMASEASATNQVKQAQETVAHNSRQFEEAGQLLSLLKLDLTDLDTDRIDTLITAENDAGRLAQELTQAKEAWKQEVNEKEAVLQEFAETSAAEIAKRDTELDRHIAENKKQTAELQSQVEEARTVAEEHVEAAEHNDRAVEEQMEQMQEQHEAKLAELTATWEAQMSELTGDMAQLNDHNERLLADARTYKTNAEESMERQKQAARLQVEKLTESVASKENEVKELKKKVKTLAKNLHEQVRTSETHAEKSAKHLQEMKAKFEGEHAQWTQTLQDERAKWQKTLSEARAKVVEEMTTKLRSERDSRVAEADQIRQDHAKLAANISRKMEEAVGDARSTMEAASGSPLKAQLQAEALSHTGSPLKADAAAAAAPELATWSGGDAQPNTALVEQQMARLHAVWQEKVDQQKAHWQAELQAVKTQSAQLTERMAACNEELKDSQAQVSATRQQMVEEQKASEQAKVECKAATDKIEGLQLQITALNDAAERAETVYNEQIADQSTALRGQVQASVAQIKSLKAEIDQLASALDEAQEEVVRAREDQFAEKLKVQTLERQVKDTSGLQQAQESLERAQAEVIQLTRELTAQKSIAEEARMEQKAAAAAVSQRDAKIASLVRAAEESESLREKLRGEQASQQALQQAKQLKAKSEQIKSLKEAATVAAERLEAASQAEGRLKLEVLEVQRRQQEMEHALAQKKLREEQLLEDVKEKEAALVDKSTEMVLMAADAEKEMEGAQRTAEMMQGELDAALKARDEALNAAATIESEHSSALVVAEEKVVDAEARAAAEVARAESEAARAAAVQVEMKQLDVLMQTIVRRFENQAQEAVEMTESFCPTSPVRPDVGDQEWAPPAAELPVELQEEQPAIRAMPSLPELPSPPSLPARRFSFASVSSEGSPVAQEQPAAEIPAQSEPSPAKSPAVADAPRPATPEVLPADERISFSVHVISARNLAKMDFGGKSDPYVVLRCGDSVHKTEVIKKTLSPEWTDAQFEFDDVRRGEVLIAEVFDWDRGTKDEPMGRVSVPLLNIDSEMRWLGLQSMPGCEKPQGELLLRCSVVTDTPSETSSGEVTDDLFTATEPLAQPSSGGVSAVAAFVAAEAEVSSGYGGSPAAAAAAAAGPPAAASAGSFASDIPSQPTTSRSAVSAGSGAGSAPITAPQTPHASPDAPVPASAPAAPSTSPVPPLNMASLEPQRMPVRGRQALGQKQVEQIAAALGLPPHKLTDELLEKPSVLALIDSSAASAAQLAEAKPSSPDDPGRVAARAKAAAAVAMTATKAKKKAALGHEGERRRPARGRGGRRRR